MSPEMTHFDRLGLPRSFALNPAEIERNYLDRSRALHPDFHQMGSSAEQRASLELTAALNEAYATLRQPLRRAEYLLGLEGGPSAAEHKAMSPAFLEEMLDLRMEIEELRSAGPESPGRVALEEQLRQRQEAIVADLTQAFAKLTVLPEESASRRPVLLEVRQMLNMARYVQGLLRDLQAD